MPPTIKDELEKWDRQVRWPQEHNQLRSLMCLEVTPLLMDLAVAQTPCRSCCFRAHQRSGQSSNCLVKPSDIGAVGFSVLALGLVGRWS